MHLLKATCSLLSILPLVAAAPTQVLGTDFPDPAIIFDGHTNLWYVFGTAGNGYDAQIASGPSINGPWTWLDINILPTKGAWASNMGVWAPDVQYIKATDSYVMYYSVPNAPPNNNKLCIGAAVSQSITGPYVPLDSAVACPLEEGGAIDPNGYFDDASQTRWLLYKTDGNSIGHGGDCNNGVEPIVPTPIMMQQISIEDGTTRIGAPFEVLDREAIDGPLVEAPSLVRAPDGTYVLFYSSNCFNDPKYDVSYATSPTLSGPYTKSGRPLLRTGDFDLTSPGGASSDVTGTLIVFHANCDAGGSGRCMYETGFSVDNNIVSFT